MIGEQQGGQLRIFAFAAASRLGFAMTKNSIAGICPDRKRRRTAGGATLLTSAFRIEALLGHEALNDLGRETAGTAAEVEAFQLFWLGTFAPCSG